MEGPECGLSSYSWAESQKPSSSSHTVHGDSLSWGFAPPAGIWPCSWPQWVWLDPKIHKLFLVGGPLGKLQFGISSHWKSLVTTTDHSGGLKGKPWWSRPEVVSRNTRVNQGQGTTASGRSPKTVCSNCHRGPTGLCVPTRLTQPLWLLVQPLLPTTCLPGGLAGNSGSRSISCCGISVCLLNWLSLFLPVNVNSCPHGLLCCCAQIWGKTWGPWASLSDPLTASPVAQWLRICLPMQGTWVQALVREDPTCRGATRSLCHSYWACALEPVSLNYWVHEPQLLSPRA